MLGASCSYYSHGDWCACGDRTSGWRGGVRSDCPSLPICSRKARLVELVDIVSGVREHELRPLGLALSHPAPVIVQAPRWGLARV